MVRVQLTAVGKLFFSSKSRCLSKLSLRLPKYIQARIKVNWWLLILKHFRDFSCRASSKFNVIQLIALDRLTFEKYVNADMIKSTFYRLDSLDILSMTWPIKQKATTDQCDPVLNWKKTRFSKIDVTDFRKSDVFRIAKSCTIFVLML